MAIKGLTSQSVADMLTAYRGVTTHYASVCSWKTGDRHPSDATIVALEAVSMGAIRREQWPCWLVRQKRRAKRAA